MNGPVAYVSTWKVKEGKFDDYVRFHDELARVVDESEPDIVAFLAFANEDGTEITGLHVFPGEAALEHHMGVLAERMGILADEMTAVLASLAPVRIEVLGQRSQRATEMDDGLVASGVPFEVKPRLFGGFVRAAR